VKTGVFRLQATIEFPIIIPVISSDNERGDDDFREGRIMTMDTGAVYKNNEA
jgi:hypothetical protein